MLALHAMRSTTPGDVAACGHSEEWRGHAGPFIRLATRVYRELLSPSARHGSQANTEQEQGARFGGADKPVQTTVDEVRVMCPMNLKLLVAV